MSVDTLRENFHINRISSDLLQDFLTAQTYRPEITLAKEKLLKLPHTVLQNLCNKPIRQGKSPKYAEKGLKCIKPRNTVDLLVSLNDIDYIDPSTENDISNQCLAYGDIVITRSGSGTIGRASIFSFNEKIYTNDHLFIVRVSKADSHYVVSFLKSYYGARLLEAGISGSTGQLNLSNEHIKQLIIYAPHTLVQKYIGEKVREAELLLSWSRSVINKWQNSFKQMYPSTDAYNIYKTSSYKLTTRQIAEVLTPESYPPEVEKYFQENSYLTLGEMSECIYTGKTLEPSFESSCVSQATSRSCSGMFFKNPMNKVETSDRVKPLKVKDLVLTNAAHEKSYIGKDVTFNHSNDYVLPSAKVLVIRIKEDKLPISYIHSYLMTGHGYIQWQSIVRGISAGIHPSDVARIRVPLPINESDYQKMVDADELFIRAGLANQVSKQLNEVAVKLIEALIEGIITEEELIQAQNTLEQGDNSLDRAILSQMTEEGYAVAGSKPLFADLDEFYELLEQAKELE
ncbi:restriction endonuclease subunit S [Acinetobacter bohemicus]|uniref:Type I restriction enzyme, S subunit n=1 Tax=Acinetobacter bohemicus TaxID=1435036 RepID=A0A1I6VHA5_9GAMM|nr:restriction endonuclease subunit S [Acinetobacter bohemicus]KAB0651341.1 restriction endonuclease subunit S [Acinetobacter bohemicus]SFT13082.1 type I restriction enzyme, S subunit [Acinetobacter bohemicus]